MKAGFGSGVAPEPGQPSQAPAFVPPAVAEVARLFPQFEVLELLGQGGMGAVYKARQPALDRLVALKILPPQTSGDAGFADRFTREARALARLNYPNIVGVYEFGQAGGLHYFVMEYVEGLNLRQLEQAGRLSPREALKIIPQICDALQFAHDEGIVHRDIKPENVMLDKKGRVKITDFGLARILGREPEGMRLTGAKDVMGTPHYMAPEQIEHPQEVDHRADIYSLGVVFYEMLTGELPLGKFQPPSKKVQVDVRLDEVVLHALEKEPERRYQHASEVKTAVETIAATPGAPAAGAPAEPPVVIKRWRDAWIWNWEYIQLYLIAPIVAAGLALPFLLPRLGLRALWIFAAELGGIAFAITYAIVGRQVRRTRAEVPRTERDVAECLMFRRPFQSPGVAVMHEDRLELIPIVGSPIIVPLADIVAVKEVRWFNGTRLFFKKGFVMELANGQRVGVAVAEVFARRWRSRLSRGALPDTAADSSRLPAKETSHFFAGPSWAVGIILGLALVAGLISWGIWERTGSVSAATVVRVEEKLRQEIEKRLHEADWRVDGISVSVTPDLKRAECRFGTAWKNNVSSIPFNAAIRVVPQRKTLWLVDGDGEFRFLHFSVDTSAEMHAPPLAFQYYAAPGAAGSAPGYAVRAPRFGPVREATLHDIDELRGGEALDFDRRQLLDLPKGIEQRPKTEQVQWLKAQSADLLLDRVGGRWGLMTPTDNELKLSRLRNESWDDIAEESLAKALATEQPGLELRQRGPWRIYALATNTPPPLTFAFGTASGTTGLLQIMRFTETPNSARLRYKLVMPGTTGGAVGLMQREFMRRYGLEAAPGPSGKTSRLEDLSKAEQARAVELFNDIEDFGHEFEAAFATKSLPAAETGTRRLLNLLSNFNAVVRGTGYEFPPGIFEDIGKVQQALKAGDWDKVQQAARGNDAYRQAFKRIAGRMVELAREQKQAAATSFGPVVERVVAGTGDANRRFIDLDTGRQFAAAEFFGPKAEPSPAETQQWWRDTGTDAMGDTSPHIRGLVGFEMVASPVPTEEWDRLPPSRLDYYLTMSAPGTPVTMSGKGELPATYAVKTREGAQGLLQIVGFSTNNPPAVRIRYKLIQLSRESERPRTP